MEITIAIEKTVQQVRKRNDINQKTYHNFVKWKGRDLYLLNLIGQISVNNSGNVRRSTLTRNHSEGIIMHFDTL